MADIKKTLTLTADLDVSKVREEIKKLKADLSSGFKIDTTPLTKFKGELKELTKAFSELKKELKEVKIPGSRSAGTRVPTTPGIGPTPADVQRELTRSPTFSKNQDLDYKYQRELYSASADKRRRRNSITFMDNFLSDRGQTKEQFQAEIAQKKEQRLQERNRFSASSSDIAKFKQQQAEGKFNYTFKEHHDRQRGKIVNLQGGESYSQLLGKKFSSREDRSRLLMDLRRERRVHRERMKNLAIEMAMREKREKTIARFASLTRGAQGLAGRLPGGLGRAASMGVGRVGAMAGRAATGLGTAGAVAGGALGLAGIGAAAAIGGSMYIRQMNEVRRQQRQAIAERDYEQATLSFQNRFLEKGVRRRARNNMGGFQKGATGLLGGLKGFFLGFGEAGKGYDAAVAEEGRAEGDVAAGEVAPLLQFEQDYIGGLRDRTRTVQGTNLGTQDVNAIEGRGRQFGFRRGETRGRFNVLKQTLGMNAMSQGLEGRGVANTLDRAMEMERRVGLGVEDQAQFMETLRGTQGGNVGVDRASRQQKEIIKTAMAAGLDASKTSRFLQTTSEYVTSTAGLANVNFDDLAREIATLSSSFATNAGRTDITDQDMRRAREVRERLQQESTSMEGIAGVGNILSTDAAMRAGGSNFSAAQYLGLMNTSANATAEQVSDMLVEKGYTGDAQAAAEEFVNKRNEGNFETGLKGLGLEDFREFFGRFRGMNAEQARAERDALRGRGAAGKRIDERITEEGDKILPEGYKNLEDFNTQVGIANKEFTSFIQGFRNVTDINKEIVKSAQDLIDAFDRARSNLEAQQRSNGTNQSRELDPYSHPRLRGFNPNSGGR